MYILTESNVSEIEGQKVSGQYHLRGGDVPVSLKVFNLNTDTPQGRMQLGATSLDTKPHLDAEAEFRQVVEGAVAECQAQGESFVNLSGLDIPDWTPPKPKSAPRATSKKKTPAKVTQQGPSEGTQETPTETEE